MSNHSSRAKLIFEMTENIVRKEENVGHEHFLFSLFLKGFFFMVVKTWNDVVSNGLSFFLECVCNFIFTHCDQ